MGRRGEWVSREPADVFSNADVKGARGRERGDVVFESHECGAVACASVIDRTRLSRSKGQRPWIRGGILRPLYPPQSPGLLLNGHFVRFMHRGCREVEETTRYDYLDAERLDAVTLTRAKDPPQFSENARKEKPSRTSLDRGLVGKQEACCVLRQGSVC